MISRPDLSPRARAANLLAMGAELYDVLVVGGGISGAGIALEAASRGLKVALVERHDFASGTSSKSSKLLHGGLRYLEQYHIGLVAEAIGERNRLLRDLPHLAREQPFLYPIEQGHPYRMLQARMGLTAYDALSLVRGGRRQWLHRSLDPAAAQAEEPILAKASLQGALWYLDGLTNDARLVVDVLKSAVLAGARIANYAPVQGFVRDSGGRASAA
ncbi:MAG: FAD-dependent oxidoreductase, partial [Cyanobacteria bacterium REEB65]|nr:FAD-dependent oxidoreductase [Cyanobacteria bacterium REEB65]